MGDMFVELARKAMTVYITTGKTIEPPNPLPQEMRGRAGVFVSIHKGSSLRGCIGTFAPTTESIAHEIIEMAKEASTADPRFPPITKSELDSLEISVDVLSEPEDIKNESELDPKVYGVIVRSRYRRGLLLPDLDGVDTPAKQIDIAKRKAGIFGNEPVTLQRFKVTRHH